MRRVFFGLIVLAALVAAGPRLLAQGDAPVNIRALMHDSRSDLYRTPGGAVPLNTPVTLRFRTAAGDVDDVTLGLVNLRTGETTPLPMSVVTTTTDGYDLWEITLDTGRKTTVLYYGFALTKNGQTLFYSDDTLPDGQNYVEANKGGPGQLYPQLPIVSYQIAVYDPAFYTPEWFRNGIIYQIFPDRFRNGDPSNDPADGSDTFYGGVPLYFHETWNEKMLDGRVDKLPNGDGYWNADFYGGDLAGITEKLDYLQALGVTGIYLNPIFAARSNHRYDTADYKQIDPLLGTLEDFRTLVREAEARGIKLILDGVFNHLSSDSPFFDRYRRYETEGACESLESPYRSWFTFVEPRGSQPSPCVGENRDMFYVSWAGFDTIPQVNNTLVETRKYFFLDHDSVARAWGREGIGGWRLDAAEQIDDGRDPNNIYWEAFRAVVRDTNPETVIIGEFWQDASPWLLGDQWDTAMNYRFRRGVIGFLRGADFVDADPLIPGLSASQLDSLLRSIEEDYPPMAYHAMMNLVDTHDTSRILFALDNDKQAQKLAALLQYTLPGAPTIYYGDEIAIDAPSTFDGSVYQDDPANRAPYPWPDALGDAYPPPDDDMLAYYRQLGALRRANPALREGKMITLAAHDRAGVYAFLRVDAEAGNAALVALNRGDRDQLVPLDYAGLLPTGLTLEPVFGGDAINTSRRAAIRIPAKSGNVWTVGPLEGGFAVPLAPQNVAAKGNVTVTWDAVQGAAGYLVYRSPVAAGGFEVLTDAPVTETTYQDTTAVNGFVYHYAVAAVGDDGLIGDLSASAMVIPKLEISATAFVDAEPSATLQLVYGAQVEIKAAVAITDVTSVEGQAAGVRAQAALIPAGGSMDAANWLAMTYDGERDGADVYAALLKPEATGDYQIAARFSADAGLTWTAVTLPDGSMPTLKVEADDDITPPAAPASMTVTRASLSGVGLEWEAVADNALAAYRLYRAQSGGEPTLLAELSPGTLAYLDVAVVDGQTYTYSVTALDAALNESSPATTEPVVVQKQTLPVTFVAAVPDYTNSALYIAGNFGSDQLPVWDPAGAGMQLTQMDATHWFITLNLPEGAKIQYKYVRGSWEAVEKGSECEEIANRELAITYDTLGEQSTDFVETGSYVVRDTIAKWRDLDACG